jgi:hypothetical protein
LCTDCAEGKYSSSEGAVGCTAASTCGAGKFTKSLSTSTSNSECEDCAIGKASIGGQLSCGDCNSEGEYSDETGLPSCKTVPSGHKSTANHDGIIACPKNTFSLGATSVCSPCLEGGHSHPGSAACEQCLTGKYFDEPNNKCELCPKNTYSTTGATTLEGCAPCTDGGYSQPGAGYCEQCITGKYFDEPSNDCKLCPAGKFSPSGASTLENCEECTDGFYSVAGAGYCTPCCGEVRLRGSCVLSLLQRRKAQPSRLI